MMTFRLVKTFIQETLIANNNNCFRVAGAQKEVKSSGETLGLLQLVEVFYASGDFGKSDSSFTGPVNQACSYRIELTTSAEAEIDLAVFDNSNAESYEIQGALSTLREASAVADDQLDELYELVYQILMDNRIHDMGQSKGKVANRWITDMKKDNPLPDGEYVTLTGVMFLTMNIEEDIVGAPILGSGNVQDITIDIDGDDVEQTGVTVNG